MPDVQFPRIPGHRELAGDKAKPNCRRERGVILALLVGLIAFGSAGCNDKESSQSLLSVIAGADPEAKEEAEQAARDLAAAEAEAKAAEDRAAADAEARAAAEAKAAAEAEALAAEKAAAEKAAAEKAAVEKAAADQAAAQKAAAAAAQQSAPKSGNCTPEYPDFCIPLAADYNCPDLTQKNFTALRPDPYRLDANKDGIACESR